MPEQRGFLCSICFKPIEFKDSKIDESGRPVHPDCYEKWVLHTPQKKNVQRVRFLQDLANRLTKIIVGR
jgi:hypothetical protein